MPRKISAHVLALATAAIQGQQLCLARAPVAADGLLPMMPGGHGKPGLVTVGNVTIAFSDWRLRRSLDGGATFLSVQQLPPHDEAKCYSPNDGVISQ